MRWCSRRPTTPISSSCTTAGVRGARFSFRQALGAVLSRDAFDRAVGKLRELGWYMKIQPEQNGIVESVPWFEHLEVPILIDHMGRPDASVGPDRDPNLAKLRELLPRGNFWVMLSLGEKISQAGAPYDDVVPMARALSMRRPIAACGRPTGRIRSR